MKFLLIPTRDLQDNAALKWHSCSKGKFNGKKQEEVGALTDVELVVDLPLPQPLDLEVVEVHALLPLGLAPLPGLLPLPLLDRPLLLPLEALHLLDLALLGHDVLEKLIDAED